MGEVELGAPVQVVGAKDVRCEHELYPLVLDVPSVDHLGLVATTWVHGQTNELVGRIGAVPSEVDAEATIEEAYLCS